MIYAAIDHIASELNQYIKRTFSLSEDMVVISNLLEQDGTVAMHANNKLVLFLVNIEKDVTAQQQARFSGPTSTRTVVTTAPLYLNLYLMVAGNFSGSHYAEGLKFVSAATSFFQRQPVLDQHNTPALDKRIEKLVLDIENMSLHDLSGLWGMLSGRYLPSVLYKVRMVTFDSGDIQHQTSALKKPNVAVGKK